jgi:outer membrane lipoprotein-sorting protein
MHGFSRTIITASILSSALLLIPLTANAQDKNAPQTPAGAGWASQVKQADDSTSRTLTAEQMNSIAAVNQYFNQINYMKGLFSQTNPDGKVQRGKFYLMRPGRFRFDYNRPSRQIIVSDGKMLAIQDLDLNNEENYSLENTPFRILLRKDVNLLRDARIMAVEQSKDQIAVTISDKSPDSPGQITIYLTPQPAPKLAGWVTTDVQGGVTRVVVSKLDRPEKLSHKLFEREKLFMKSIQ